MRALARTGPINLETREPVIGSQEWRKSARMSRSALRDEAADGGVFRIVTLRLYEGDKAEAKEKCEKLKYFMEVQ